MPLVNVNAPLNARFAPREAPLALLIERSVRAGTEGIVMPEPLPAKPNEDYEVKLNTPDVVTIGLEIVNMLEPTVYVPLVNVNVPVVVTFPL